MHWRLGLALMLSAAVCAPAVAGAMASVGTTPDCDCYTKDDCKGQFNSCELGSCTKKGSPKTKDGRCKHGSAYLTARDFAAAGYSLEVWLRAYEEAGAHGGGPPDSVALQEVQNMPLAPEQLADIRETAIQIIFLCLGRASYGDSLPHILGTFTPPTFTGELLEPFAPGDNGSVAALTPCQLLKLSLVRQAFVGELEVPGQGIFTEKMCAIRTACADQTTYGRCEYPHPASHHHAVNYADGLECLTAELAASLQTLTRGHLPQLGPSLTAAFPITEDTVLAVFDSTLSPETAEVPSHYHLSSLGTVTAAALASPTSVRLAIAGAAPHGQLERLTVEGITAATSGLSADCPQTQMFYRGVQTISEIRAPDPAYLDADPCQDRSRFAGTDVVPATTLTTVGTCVARFGDTYYFADSSEAALRAGLAVYSPDRSYEVGDYGLLVGQVVDDEGETQLLPIAAAPPPKRCPPRPPCVIIWRQGVCVYLCPHPSSDDALAAALRRSDCDASQSQVTGDDLEGQLVTFAAARVVSSGPSGADFAFVAHNDPNDTLWVRNRCDYVFAPMANQLVDITAVVIRDGVGFALAPPSDDQIAAEAPSGVVLTGGDLRFSVVPNPGRSVLISFRVPDAAVVDLGVFDVSGRRVATLTRGQMAAGLHVFGWNGLSSEGRVTSGVFFFRLAIGARRETLMRAMLR